MNEEAQKQKKRYIFLAGLISDQNLGDQAIYLSTRKMVEDIIVTYRLTDIEIKTLDISGVNTNHPTKNIILKIFSNFKWTLKKFLVGKDQAYMEQCSKTAAHICDRKINKDTIAIIFVGGGLIKYKHQYFWIFIDAISKYAAKFDIPVMFSAVGVEGYDENHPVCMVLKKTLNLECVKIITTRDDLDCLNNNYIYNKNISIAKVADPACSFRSVYCPIRHKKTHCIGLGVVRAGLFEDYGITFSKMDMLELWSKLYLKIIENGYECKLFCNGANADYQFLEDLKKYIATKSKVLPDYIPCPKTPTQLIDGICSCEGLIVGRLHASILAYAYDVPCISLVWNNKQIMFGQQIQHVENFIKIHEFNPELIMDRLMIAMKEKNDISIKQQYCITTKQYLENFIANYCRS